MPSVKARNSRPRLGSFTVSPWRTKRRAEHSTPPGSRKTIKPNADAEAPAARNAGAGQLSERLATFSDGERSCLASSAAGAGEEDPAADQDAFGTADDDEEYSTDLSGVASIVWLSTGAFSGHFVDSESRMCFGLHGRELAQVQECTRDEDKKLLLLIVTDYRGGEVSTAVEKGGGDLAKLGPLSSDSEWEEMTNDLALQVRVDFQCLQMKTGIEAEAYISQALPKLQGLGGVLNKGRMELHKLPIPPLTAE